jgi:hypothetical protein
MSDAARPVFHENKNVDTGSQYKNEMLEAKCSPLSWLAGTSPSDLRNRVALVLELFATEFSPRVQRWGKQLRTSRWFPALISGCQV